MYGENTFGIALSSRRLDSHVILSAVDAMRDHLFPLAIVTRIAIVLWVHDWYELKLARALAGMLAWALAKPTKLRSLSFELRTADEVYDSYRVLEPLTSLRNVGHVSFSLYHEGDKYRNVMPKSYVMYLRSFMEAGSSPRPLRNLAPPRLRRFFYMYRALLKYSFGYNVDDILFAACEAMMKCDFQKFKMARQEIIDLADPKGDRVPPWLFKSDPKVVEEGGNP